MKNNFKIFSILTFIMLIGFTMFACKAEVSEDDAQLSFETVQTLYGVGEQNLTTKDIIKIGNVDCYVLKVEGNKAEMITKEIYNEKFHTTDNNHWKYAECTLKTWMDNFYSNNLLSDPRIVKSTVKYYYQECWDHDAPLNIDDTKDPYTIETLEQYVFPLDASEGCKNCSKFSWAYYNNWEDPLNSDPEYLSQFWTTAATNDQYGYGDAYGCGYTIKYDGTVSTMPGVNSEVAGARPVFWVQFKN